MLFCVNKFENIDIGINLHDLKLDNGFLDMIPKAQTTKKIYINTIWTSSKFEI